MSGKEVHSTAASDDAFVFAVRHEISTAIDKLSHHLATVWSDEISWNEAYHEKAFGVFLKSGLMVRQLPKLCEDRVISTTTARALVTNLMKVNSEYGTPEGIWRIAFGQCKVKLERLDPASRWQFADFDASFWLWLNIPLWTLPLLYPVVRDALEKHVLHPGIGLFGVVNVYWLMHSFFAAEFWTKHKYKAVVRGNDRLLKQVAADIEWIETLQRAPCDHHPYR